MSMKKIYSVGPYAQNNQKKRKQPKMLRIIADPFRYVCLPGLLMPNTQFALAVQRGQ